MGSLLRKLFLALLLYSSTASFGQRVGINILYPDSSALLQLESDSLGFLPPRMTTAQRDAIKNPATGLVIYNIEDSVLQVFNGKCWLSTFQKSCDECLFEMRVVQPQGYIDRINSDTAGTDIIITQTSGTPQTIGFFLFHNLPSGVTAQLDSYTVNGSGRIHLTVRASIFSDPGTYPVAIQGMCGSTIITQFFVVTIDSCYEVFVMGNQTDYDLQADANLPGPGNPVCVVVHIMPGALLEASDTLTPAFTSGNLDPATHVGIDNQGAITARGGDGGVGGNLSNFGMPGSGGGDAIHLTSKTTLLNNGYIFGGGGGGASVGFGQTFNIPVIGQWSLAIGAGGGGGAAYGQGGTTGAIPIPFFADGMDATGGINGQGGNGGILTTPISIPVQVVTINITPNVYGGDGGDYGEPGQAGYLSIALSVTVPVVGTVSIPVPPVTNFPRGGSAGMAIKRNNNPLIGLPDGNYNTSFIKGVIGP